MDLRIAGKRIIQISMNRLIKSKKLNYYIILYYILLKIKKNIIINYLSI